ncbi:Uncharacterized protein HZ326_15419 [Fusarium oxysporum f. sp. albedinis]|nr:Uncharacterized protein HZ326_15419 [Fusarium oxysporum f. sp. albedinis]
MDISVRQPPVPSLSTPFYFNPLSSSLVLEQCTNFRLEASLCWRIFIAAISAGIGSSPLALLPLQFS